ncbi:UNVERIFIED_CONTAM: hypothetical protein GTU68_060638 [Idotea baltica]|nr:hypothetical protein [Idotea baltica]
MSLKLLQTFLASKQNIFVLTGAGVSAESGIPTYRDHQGKWLRNDPIQHLEFLEQKAKRQRYWTRSMVGWKHVQAAKPNGTHMGLARWESMEKISLLVTQNVDGLHQRAGSRNVLDLHGRLSEVVCLDCDTRSSRADLQPRLEAENPDLANFAAACLPDGDADIDDFDIDNVAIPECSTCGGMLKPDVVFFGGAVPKPAIEKAFDALSRSDAVLVIGSSLTVFSGFRFCRKAAETGIPIACINQGKTRADELFSVKVEMAASDAISQMS